MESIDANGSVVTLPLIRALFAKLDKDDVVCIRMHPVTAQAYEESGFVSKVEFIPLAPGQQLNGEEGMTICGKPLYATLSQSEHFVDLVGCNGKTIGQITNLSVGDLGWGPEDVLRFGNRGRLSYKTVSQQLEGKALAK